MYCTKCGKQIPDDVAFCPECGAPVSAESAEPVIPEAPAVDVPVAEEVPAAEEVFAQLVEDAAPTQEAAQSEAAAPVKEKKKFPVWIVGVAAAVIVVIIALCNFSGLTNFALRTFSSPEKYYQFVEKKAVAELAGDIASVYGNDVYSALDIEKKYAGANIEIKLEDGAMELLEDLTGEDFDWLEKVSLTTSANRKDDQSETTMALSLGKDQLLSFDFILDAEEGMAYGCVPELSKSYFEMDVSELLDVADLYYYDADDLADLFEQSAKLYDAAPNEKTVEQLFARYLTLALEQIDNVDKDHGKLSAQGVSANYTTLKVTINSKTLQKIIEAVCDELKDDKDVKKLLENIEKQFDIDLYDNFLDVVEELGDNAKDVAKALDDKIVMVLYVDGKGEVCGRSIKYGDVELLYAMPVKGGKFGFELSVDDGWDAFSVAGSGKCSGDVYSGEFSLKSEHTKLLKFTLDKFDVGQLKQGFLKGGITVEPTKDLLDEMGLGRSAREIVEDLSVRLDLSTKSGGGDVTVTVYSGKDKFATLTCSAESGSAKSITSVKSSDEIEDWVEDLLDSDALEDWVDDLRKTDIPDDYLDMIEDELEYLY